MEIELIKKHNITLLDQTLKLFKADMAKDAEQFAINPTNYFFVATDNKEPVGYLLAYKLCKPERAKPMFFIYEIEVSENARRHGVATKLIKTVFKTARQNNASKIFVPTNKSNIAATNLYAKTGGVIEHKDDVFYIYHLD